MQRFPVIALLASVLLLSSISSANATSCASAAEQQSLHMRALQSELMVAALACGKKQDYNRYVSQFAPDLKWQGGTLRSYFQRQFGGASERQLNRFVTQMANQASRLSLARSRDEYCGKAANLFSKVNDSRPWQVVDYASDHYGAWHAVASCDTRQVLAQK